MKRQLNFTPRWTAVRSLVCEAPERFPSDLELQRTLPLPPTGHCWLISGAGNWRLWGGGHETCDGTHYLQHSIDEQEVIRRLPAAQVLGHLKWLFALLHTLGESGSWGWAGWHRSAGGLGHLTEDRGTVSSKPASGSRGPQPQPTISSTGRELSFQTPAPTKALLHGP